MMPMMNVNNPVVVWVISRLFQDDEMAIPRRTLMKDICSKSIETMQTPEELQEALDNLTSEGLAVESSADHYQITEKGLFAFRKEIVGAVQKRKSRLELNIDYYISKYKEVAEVLNTTEELALAHTRLMPHVCKAVTARRMASS
jgi:hypothetical protein